jgi:cytochrome c556
MRFVTKAVILSLTLSAGMAVAKEGVQDPTVKARMDLMGVNAQNTKILGDMAGGKADFDAAAAEAAKMALAAAAADIAAKFEPEAADPVSEALPDIWMNWDGFAEKAKALETAAGALDVSSLESLQGGMAAVGGACKGCHTDFRAKK